MTRVVLKSTSRRNIDLIYRSTTAGPNLIFLKSSTASLQPACGLTHGYVWRGAQEDVEQHGEERHVHPSHGGQVGQQCEGHSLEE